MFDKPIVAAPQIEYSCVCPARDYSLSNQEREQYFDQYDTVFAGTNQKGGILILLEFRQVDIRLKRFIDRVKGILLPGTYQVRTALGCSPFSSISNNKEAGVAYSYCKQTHIDKIIKDIQPNVILTTGRAIQTISNESQITHEEFYYPILNDQLHKYEEDAYFWSKEYSCRVYPLPHIHHVCLANPKTPYAMIYEYGFLSTQLRFAAQYYQAGIFDEAGITPQFSLIDDPISFLKELANSNFEYIALDTETGGLNYLLDQLYFISLAYERNKAIGFYFKKEYVEALIELFNKKKFIMQNAKFDLKFLIRNGVYNAHCEFDTKLAKHNINENTLSGLKVNSIRYTKHGNYAAKIHKEFQKLAVKDEPGMFLKLPKDTLVEYACYDALATFELYHKFKDRVTDNFHHVLMPVVTTMTDLEYYNPITIDYVFLDSYVNELKAQIKEIETEMYKLAGYEFNIRSKTQFSKVIRELYSHKNNGSIIFDDEGLRSLPFAKNKEDILTSREVLEKFDKEYDISKYPILANFTNYLSSMRELSLLVEKEAISNSYMTNSSNDEMGHTGILGSIYKGQFYSVFDLVGTKTGRISSRGGLNSKFNAQNIPIHTKFKHIFMPRHNCVFLDIDYVSMEVKHASQLSGQGKLEELLLSNKDMHFYFASRIWERKGIVNEKTGKPWTDDELKEAEAALDVPANENKYTILRGVAKAAFFSIIYGASADGLAETLDVPSHEAQEYIDTLYDTYKEYAQYIKENFTFVKQNGYVETLTGYRRHIPEFTFSMPLDRNILREDNIYFRKYFSKLNKLRNAVMNAPMQGSSGQTTLLALCNIHLTFKEKRFKSKILNTVHDSILFELHKDEAVEAIQIIEDLMTLPYYENKKENRVRLSIKANIGSYWNKGMDDIDTKNPSQELIDKHVNITNKRHAANR